MRGGGCDGGMYIKLHVGAAFSIHYSDRNS